MQRKGRVYGGLHDSLSPQKHVSASKEERARDFRDLWLDPDVDAIIPPWGGELLIEILPLLDFQELAQTEPKWVMGYSDISTLLLPLTLMTHIATVHGTCLMEQVPNQTDALTARCLEPLGLEVGAHFQQISSLKYQEKWTDIVKEPERGFYLTEETCWKNLHDPGETVSFSGRLIGGCLDTLACLVGTAYGDVPAFLRRYQADGVVLYLENCELNPCTVSRTLWNMRLAGWIDGLAGILIGRSAGPDATEPDQLTYVEAVSSALGDLDIPVIHDCDIGHKCPQMTLLNGALAKVEYENGQAAVVQKLS